MGTEVDILYSYKRLGVHTGNKLEWTKNHLYFLRRLRSFNVYRTMLQMFYHYCCGTQWDLLCCSVLEQWGLETCVSRLRLHSHRWA